MKQKQLLAGISAGLISLGMASSANAALIGRLAATLGGGDYQAYYDDVADITWLADTNYAQTSGYAAAHATGGLNFGSNSILADGRMGWGAANAWAAQLTVGGVSGWRLTKGNACSGYNCTGSEIGDLFYNTLGNTAGFLWSYGPFSNIQSDYYWTDTEFVFSTDIAWAVNFSVGDRSLGNKNIGLFAWAVHPGDVGASAVPVPAAVWLFGSGLIGLVSVARRAAS